MENLSNEAVLHVKKDNIEFLQFRKLLEYKDSLFHCYTLKPLDFNPDGKENKVVEKSCQRVVNTLTMEDKKIIRLLQVHGDNIEKIDKIEKWDNNFKEDDIKNVDGVMTNQKDILLTLRYADCIPLYFYDPIKKVIANIHSGWKGTVQKIGKKAVSMLVQQYHCQPKDIICCIGPCIRRCHFEVEEEVKDVFTSTFGYMVNSEKIVQKGRIVDGIQKYNIDTVQINCNMLEEAGIVKSNIIDSGICTYCHSTLLHSYRKEGKQAGRNAAMIGLIT